MSTQPTEPHRELVREMALQGHYLNRSIEHYAQLLADSEARAVEDAVAAIIEKNAPEIAKTNAAFTTLEIELARLRAEAAEMSAQRSHNANEAGRLRAEVERLKKQIKDDNRSYGCELRDPNGTIWEQAAKDHARAERAEAEIERWRDSNNRLRAEMESQAQRAERVEAMARGALNKPVPPSP